MSWFNLSFVGWIILIAALALGAYKLHVPTIWIGIAALALVGIGVIASVGKAKPGV